MLALAKEKGLSYVDSAGFVAWSSAVLSNAHKPSATATATAVTASTTLVHLDAEFAIQGSVPPDAMSSIAASCIYVPTKQVIPGLKVGVTVVDSNTS